MEGRCQWVADFNSPAPTNVQEEANVSVCSSPNDMDLLHIHLTLYKLYIRAGASQIDGKPLLTGESRMVR